MVPSTEALVLAEQFSRIESDLELMREVCDPEQLGAAASRYDKLLAAFRAVTLEACSPYHKLPKPLRAALAKASDELAEATSDFNRYLPKLIALCQKAGVTVPDELKKLSK